MGIKELVGEIMDFISVREKCWQRLILNCTPGSPSRHRALSNVVIKPRALELLLSGGSVTGLVYFPCSALLPLPWPESSATLRVNSSLLALVSDGYLSMSC